MRTRIHICAGIADIPVCARIIRICALSCKLCLHGFDQCLTGILSDNAVRAELIISLELLDRSFCRRAEIAVHTVAAVIILQLLEQAVLHPLDVAAALRAAGADICGRTAVGCDRIIRHNGCTAVIRCVIAVDSVCRGEVVASFPYRIVRIAFDRIDLAARHILYNADMMRRGACAFVEEDQITWLRGIRAGAIQRTVAFREHVVPAVGAAAELRDQIGKAGLFGAPLNEERTPRIGIGIAFYILAVDPVVVFRDIQ